MRPSTKLFHVNDASKDKSPESSRGPRPRVPSIVELDLNDDAAPGVSAEAWRKARGWASED
jgi:hypothetical protein